MKFIFITWQLQIEEILKFIEKKYLILYKKRKRRKKGKKKEEV